MKQIRTISGLITVISLLLGVIWLSPVFAVEPPSFVSLGQVTAEGILRVPGAMDLDESGNLYVADARGGLVHTFSPYGALLQSFDLDASGRGLAVTPDGDRLYVSLEGSVAIVDAADGSVLGSLAGAASDGPEFGVAGEIDLDAAGNVFVADTSNMLIKTYNASGQYQGAFGGEGPDAGQFLQIGGMAINPAGQVVVTDTSTLNAKVHVFSVSAELEMIGVVTYANGVAANFGTPVMHAPKALTFAANGDGYFLEYLTSQVRVVSESFVYLGKYAQAGTEEGQLNNVIDAIFDDANGRLFVGCDTGRIEIFGVNGGQNPVSVNHAPTKPVLQSPIADSEVDSAKPTLVINNASDEDGDALTYNVVVVNQNDEDDFQVISNVAAEVGDTTSVDVTFALAENAAYLWTVHATDGAASSESLPASFVVNADEEAPSVPELIAPLNNVESITDLGALSWADSTDPDPNDVITYQVEVALDEAFGQIVFATEEGLAETALSLDSFEKDLVVGSAYFWRVISEDDEKVSSVPSDVGQFVYRTTALTITANMPDAVVSFSGNHAYAGQTIGVAPIELRDFTPGIFSVVVERAGFEPFVAQVSLVENESVDIYAELVPAKVVNKRTPSAKGINGRRGLSVDGAAVPFLVDFNNDGALDLLVGDKTGQVTFFANMRKVRTSRIAFNAGVTLDLPVLPSAVPFVADWNNDGRKDLIVGLADGSVKLFINKGLEEAPAFGAGVDLLVAGSVLSVEKKAAPVVVDYNGDGNKDLLVGNAYGQVVVYMNQAGDADPVLAAPQEVAKVNSAVVPFMADWDADGQLDLLLTAKGKISVFSQVDGVYQKVQRFGDRRTEYTGVFPIDLAGSGKQLLVGQKDGKLVLLTGKSEAFAASFNGALQDKVAELAELVAEEAPAMEGEVNAISAMVVGGDYAAAALAVEALATNLRAGAAQTVAVELAALCK